MAKWGSFTWGDGTVFAANIRELSAVIAMRPAVVGASICPAWRTPVYDRTAADAAYARAHPEASADLKGAFNVGDHWRIQGNTAHVRALLEAEGFDVPDMTYASVAVASLAWAAYFNLLAENIEVLRRVLLPSTEGIDYPNAIDLSGYETLRNDYAGGYGQATVDYAVINGYEKDLYILRRTAAALPGYTPYSGAFYSGADIDEQLFTGVV